uniref:Calcium responsive transcription factor n=1 Tax=Seriola dumerili TaxID=41447 RepID=A0A3B4TFB4_SERDU
MSSDAPSWALRLRSVEKLGDSYRGFCCSGAEVEAILLLHKQETGCVFGTRQSPSLDKPATRLMWKSQYVPYDGIPFVNAGSRAVVMECQFGPRRKGQQPKKNSELTDEVMYKATCPARIYIKKVRKFPEFRVSTELTADRKTVRQEQEKAFQCLKNQNLETGGVIRFYLQLPTEKAHLYHSMDLPPIPPSPPDLPVVRTVPSLPPCQTGLMPSRLHPRVAERIRQLVAAGHHQVYTVRKQLRRFVEKELFKSEGLPERHNLRFFPTINDIKNHIHESQKALGLTASATEVIQTHQNINIEYHLFTETNTRDTRSQTHSDLDCLSPEAVQLFSSLTSLQPKIFAQLQVRHHQQPVDSQSVQNQSVRNQSVQNQSVQNQSVQSQSVQNQSVQNQSVQSQSLQNHLRISHLIRQFRISQFRVSQFRISQLIRQFRVSQFRISLELKLTKVQNVFI